VQVQVTLRGALAGEGLLQRRVNVHLPWGATVEHLMGHLSIASGDVQMALINGSPAARTTVLSNGDRVTLAGAN
jgi:hypothetical protein